VGAVRGESTVSGDWLRAERPDHAWTCEFQFAVSDDGRAVKVLYIVGEFTREALAMETEVGAGHRRRAIGLVRIGTLQAGVAGGDGEEHGCVGNVLEFPGSVTGRNLVRRVFSDPPVRTIAFVAYGSSSGRVLCHEAVA
jgi:hypothetical protein